MYNLLACICFIFCAIRLFATIIDCLNHKPHRWANLAFALAEAGALLALIVLGATSPILI